MTEYMIQVHDKENLSDLNEYGVILYVAKLNNIVVMEVDLCKLDRLKCHPNIIKIEESKRFALA